MDITMLRDLSIDFHGLENADKEYVLYYDETNNPRKVKLTQKGFNHDVRDYFILGGLVFQNQNLPSDKELDELFNKLDVTINMKEIKFKHVKQKSQNFLNLITKRRVKLFIKWMCDNNYWVHYSYRNNFYYSLVDIVDSMNESSFGGFSFSQNLKTTLYEYGKADAGTFLSILANHDYPNVKDHKLFLNELINWIEYINISDDFELEYLRQSLKSARKSGLSLLKENEDEITIKTFSDIYFNCFCMLVHSEHIYDEEYEIQEKLANKPFVYKGEKLTNYKFINSADNRLIQLSDVFLGILRMLFRYIEENEPEVISLDFEKLAEDDKKTLIQLQEIMLNSINENVIFKHGSASEVFEMKLNIFLEYQYFR